MEADLFNLSGERGVIRTISCMPASHYTFKLQGFSKFAKNYIDKHTTLEFEVEGYKWKLIVYPNGNKSKDANGNISVYLMVVESSLPNLLSEVHALFRVFLYNHNNDTYYTLQDSRRFHKMKLEWGFDNFIPLKKFNDPSSGFLFNDTCVFGVQVIVCNKNDKGEQLVMMNPVNSYKHTWKVERFSSIATFIDSTTFNSGNKKWKLQLYPKGNITGTGSHISVYLTSVDLIDATNASQIHVEYTIRIIDRVHGKNHSYKATFCFTKSSTSFGWATFLSHKDFNDSSKGFLVNDSCIFETEVAVLGVANAL